MRSRGTQVLSAVLVGLLGFAITVQVRGHEAEDYSSLRGAELVELLKSLDSANERLGTQIDELTATRDNLKSSSQRSEEARRQAAERARQLAILAGTVGATGPGVTVTIEDPLKAVDAAALLDAVSELRDAGAEAIVLNGVARVVAQTYFVDDGTSVRVGGRELKRPFVLEAIGDASTLAEAVRFRGGLVDRVDARGGSVQVTKHKRVTITALAEVKSPEYARPTS